MASPDGVRAWHAAIQIAVRTRQLLTHFPPRGYAELKDQMIRSSESIANNIGEGRASRFPLEYAKYLDTAARSSGELRSQLTTAMEYGIVPRREALNLKSTAICASKMIESLSESVRENYEAEKQARKRKRTPRRKKTRASGSEGKPAKRRKPKG
jgi:four helix bundle protein